VDVRSDDIAQSDRLTKRVKKIRSSRIKSTEVVRNLECEIAKGI
jgi:hypothetical protein